MGVWCKHNHYFLLGTLPGDYGYFDTNNPYFSENLPIFIEMVDMPDHVVFKNAYLVY